ncbi:unnamed protein product [Calicophoron daubneyi]|uniref:Uncharacterized protein n=1 Tax=Calicophoron daubneyi TaxID=300641 RepID=A0AAV2TM29_CALDB
MADGWDNIYDEIYKRKVAMVKRRQLELIVRSNTIRDMYHGILESIIGLYKDNRDDLHSWHQFRAAADKLAEMHKFIKLTVAKVYELGTAEGAANYSQEFFEKLKELQSDSAGQNIPFEFLRGYLSQPDDPPPRPPHRRKRLAVRQRMARKFPPWEPTPSTQQNGESSLETPVQDRLEDSECLSMKKARLSPPIVSQPPPASSPLTESDSYCSEDSATSLSSSCTCEDCLTDTSSSTNDDDEGDSRYEPHDSCSMADFQASSA